MAQIALRDYLQEIEDALNSKPKRTEEAQAKCQRALEHFPESLEAQRLLGEVHLAQGQLEEARHAFDWVLTNDPENVIAYCDRALISERESDYETALDCYQQAYELSNGNSNIREEFNKLSVRTGQQGFMFSRAGLARLYMRGGLLSQAIQEWETVLTSMPDRLDARVGLLETYWHEGSYDKVDELSKQILIDIPGCLKALLLQAYVASPRDMLEAQDIMRRAETLDPDLLMAQDLFSDVITSQPTNPFLKLIRKKPAVLEAANGKVASPTIVSSRDYAQVPAEGLLNTNLPADALANWSGLDEWNGIDTFKPLPSQQPEQLAPSFSTWTGESAAPPDPWQALDTLPSAASKSAPNVDAWETPDRSPEQPPQGFQFDAWQVSESNPVDLTVPTHQPTPEHKPWEGSEDAAYPAPDFDEINSWSSFSNLQGEDAGNTWSSGSSASSTMSATPAWLNMLTQADQQQANPSGAPMEPPVARQAAPTSEPPAAKQPQPTVPVTPRPAPDPLPPWDVEPALSSFSADADEEFSFGPEWLKSLGATSMEEETPSEVEPEPELPPPAPVITSAPAPAPSAQPAYDPWASSAPAPEPSSQPTYDPWASTAPVPEPSQQSAYDPWASTAPVPPSSASADENLLTTLKDLEQNLRAQGFVPHEPNSLSTIAQSQPPAVPEPQPVASQQEAVPYELSDLTSALAQQRAALSSALEQLGSLNGQYQSAPAQPAWSVPAAEPPASPVWSAPSVSEPAQPEWSAPVVEPDAPLEEPAWVAALRSLPASTPAPHREQPFYKDGPPTYVPPTYVPPTYVPSAPLDTPLEPAARSNAYVADTAYQQPAPFYKDGPPTYVPAAPLDTPLEPAAHVEAYPGPLYQPQAAPTPVPAPEPTRVPQPVLYSEPAPENELEMTMKRPALRLPPTPTPQPRERVSDVTEAISTVGKVRSSISKDTPLSSRERLLKGYQHQLVGDYDEAMQDYRFLIRNAPEMLAEVISNLRALLKLAPKYAAGYRVLGDAYMRQGEYLQAMESYNKALTMAKKSRN